MLPKHPTILQCRSGSTTSGPSDLERHTLGSINWVALPHVKDTDAKPHPTASEDFPAGLPLLRIVRKARCSDRPASAAAVADSATAVDATPKSKEPWEACLREIGVMPASI